MIPILQFTGHELAILVNSASIYCANEHMITLDLKRDNATYLPT